jgi:hypothetical protein
MLNAFGVGSFEGSELSLYLTSRLQKSCDIEICRPWSKAKELVSLTPGISNKMVFKTYPRRLAAPSTV